MKINRYVLHAGKLLAQPSLDGWPKKSLGKLAENWFDVEASIPEELGNFLAPLGMHPLQLKRCLDTIHNPGVVSFGKVLWMDTRLPLIRGRILRLTLRSCLKKVLCYHPPWCCSCPG